MALVTPCVGVWIEIVLYLKKLMDFYVTPCVGVWIEINRAQMTKFFHYRHSLRGSVD